MAAAISERQDSFPREAVIFKRHFSDVIASNYFSLTTYLWTVFYILERAYAAPVFGRALCLVERMDRESNQTEGDVLIHDEYYLAVDQLRIGCFGPGGRNGVAPQRRENMVSSRAFRGRNFGFSLALGGHGVLDPASGYSPSSDRFA